MLAQFPKPTYHRKARLRGELLVAKAAIDVKTVADDDEFRGTFHVYEPYRAGLPRNFSGYLKELWRRREFMNEMTRANVRANQLDTLFGRLWNVINPLLMGLVYLLLVLILARGATIPNYFVYLLAGLFIFDVLETSMSQGAKSVTSAGKMVTNTAFPKALLPLSAVRGALAELWPSLVVLVVAALVFGVRPQLTWLLAIPILVLLTVFCAGLAMLVATMQVYFRDTRSFLPYFMRLWFFASPVLWAASQLPESGQFLRYLNPMFDFVATWSDAIVYGQWPNPQVWLVMSGWALVALLLGGYVFLSRERDFAVRI